MFRGWPDGLPDVDVWALQLPGRGVRTDEAPLERFAELRDAVASRAVALLDRRWALFGHSLGGLLGYEVVRELRRRGAPPPCQIVVSGIPCPQDFDRASVRRLGPVHELPEEEFLAMIEELGGTPGAVLQSVELMRMLAPMLRADLKVVYDYRYEPTEPLESPIALFTGKSDRVVEPWGYPGWVEHTRGRFEHSTFDGDHYFVMHEEAAVLARLRSLLS